MQTCEEESKDSEKTKQTEVLKQEAEQAGEPTVGKQEVKLVEAPKDEAKSATPSEDMKLVQIPAGPKEEATSATPKTLAISVGRLNGEAILRNVEMSPSDAVGMIKRQVEEALGGKTWRRKHWEVDLTVKGCKLLEKLTIEESGLVDGTTITASIKQMPVAEPGCHRMNACITTVPAKVNTDEATAKLDADGTVVASGDPLFGGDCSNIMEQLVEVQRIYSNPGAFAALKADGSVVAWGNPMRGGDCSKVKQQLAADVEYISWTKYAFAALKVDGTVVAWGHANGGGDCSEIQEQLVDVQDICATERAFAALKADGSVVAWGWSKKRGGTDYGGDISGVQGQLVDVQQISSGSLAFAALKADGDVVVWGMRNKSEEAQASDLKAFYFGKEFEKARHCV